MAIHAIPVILYVEGDSFQESKKAVSEWFDEEVDSLPIGTDEVDCEPESKIVKGQKVICLPIQEDEEENIKDDDDSNEKDDFNDFDPIEF